MKLAIRSKISFLNKIVKNKSFFSRYFLSRESNFGFLGEHSCHFLLVITFSKEIHQSVAARGSTLPFYTRITATIGGGQEGLTRHIRKNRLDVLKTGIKYSQVAKYSKRTQDSLKLEIQNF